MPLEKPKSSWVWLKIPLDHPVEVVVIGEVHTWQTHWCRPPGSRVQVCVRCVREERGRCDWCQAGFEQRPRYVFPVRYEDEVRLVELGAPQYGMLSLSYHSGRWLGQRMALARERPKMNAPIHVRLMGHERVPPEALVDCGDYVKELGRSQLTLLQDAGRGSPSSNGTPPLLRDRAGSREPTL